MIPHDLFPIALRNAKPEEQLQYLLQRRAAIDKLLRSLEQYARQRSAYSGEVGPIDRPRTGGHGMTPFAESSIG